MRIAAEDWPGFSQLVDRMLDVPIAEREAWVKRLTGVDAAWAPRLAELLRGADRPVWWDTLPKFADLDDTYAGPIIEEPEVAEVGPYRLLRLLGRGGMGTVWYAERSDGLVRRGIALKLPLGFNADAVLAARFARERDIVASLSHPNIARLYDAGIAANGQPYLALEYVEGEPLDVYCDKQRLDVAARIRLFVQVLDAMQYAHSRLVIHRDLKPSNILVTRDGDVRLLDFGVAKLLDSDAADVSELTRMGGAAMTLNYASPEQVAGQVVSTAADIYSLGVVFYELLVGNLPYRLKRASRGALEEAILAGDIPVPSSILNDTVVAARSTSLAKLRRTLHGDLDAVLLKMLQREPERRYPTMTSVADDLERLRRGRTVQAHRPSRWYWLRKFVARNRLIVASAAMAAAALLLGTGLALWQAREAERQAGVADTERDRAQAATQHRQAVDDFMSDLLLDAGRTGRSMSLTTLIARADELSGKAFAQDPEARAAVLATVGRFAWNVNGIDDALPYFEKAQTLIAHSHDLELRAHILCTLALMRGELGLAELAQRSFLAVIDDPQSPAAARSECWGNLARLAIVRYDGATAAEAVARGLQQWQNSPRHSPMERLKLLRYRAEALALNGRPADAEGGYAEVMQQLQQLGRERSDLSADVRADRFSAALYSGDLKLALEQADDAIAMLTADFPDRPAPAIWVYHRSAALAYLGRYAEALEGFEKVAHAAASPDRLSQQRAELDAAAALSKLGRREEAEQHYRDAVDMKPAATAPVPSTDIAALLTRAKLDLDAGRYRAARESLTRVLTSPSVGKASLATAHRLRAQSELGDGDVEEALEDAETAVALSDKERGDKAFSAWVGQSKLVLGQVWDAKGDTVQARAAYVDAVEQMTSSVDAAHPALRQARLLAGLRSAPAR